MVVEKDRHIVAHANLIAALDMARSFMVHEME